MQSKIRVSVIQTKNGDIIKSLKNFGKTLRFGIGASKNINKIFQVSLVLDLCSVSADLVFFSLSIIHNLL